MLLGDASPKAVLLEDYANAHCQETSGIRRGKPLPELRLYVLQLEVVSGAVDSRYLSEAGAPNSNRLSCSCVIGHGEPPSSDILCSATALKD